MIYNSLLFRNYEVISMKIWPEVVFRSFLKRNVNNKMKEILKVEETNSESQIVIKAAKYGN